MIIASILLASHSYIPKSPPSWFDYKIAGYILANDEQHSTARLFDPQRGYFLIRDGECDGAFMSLLLTRDRKEILGKGIHLKKEYPEDSNVVVTKPIPSLSTGKGVTMGDQMSRVIARLGRPTKRHRTGARHQYVELVYSCKSGESDTGRQYDQTYTFRGNKLVEIEFSWLPLDGG